MNGDRLTRWTAVAAVVAVAAVAALISYRHAVEVVTAHGEPGTVGRMYPVVIDGLIIAASMVLLDAARHGEHAPPLAWWLLGAGIGATLAVNVLAGVPAGWLGAVVAAWPTAAFVGCYELVMILVRASARRAVLPGQRCDRDNGDGDGEPPDGPSPELPCVTVPSDAAEAAKASMRATVAAGNPWTVNRLAERFSLSRATAMQIRRDVLAEADDPIPQDQANAA